MMPGYAKLRHPVVEKRLAALAAYAETAEINRWEKGSSRALGIVTSSTCYQYVREALGDEASILKLGMIWPLPEKLLREFAASVDRLVVVEELDPFLELHLRAMGLAAEGRSLFSGIGELSQNAVAEKLGRPVPAGVKLDAAIPARPPVMEAAVVGLEMPDSYYAEFGAHYAHMKELFTSGLRNIGIPFSDPQGTYFVLADIGPYLKKGQTDVEFCEEMVDKVGVACVPGTSFFQENVQSIVRLHFAKKDETLLAALDRLSHIKEKMA